MRLIVLLAVFVSACAGSPTGPTAPAPNTSYAGAQRVTFVCEDIIVNGEVFGTWCHDIDSQEPTPPTAPGQGMPPPPEYPPSPGQ